MVIKSGVIRVNARSNTKILDNDSVTGQVKWVVTVGMKKKLFSHLLLTLSLIVILRALHNYTLAY